MGADRHYIQKQSFRIDVDSEPVAMALQGRLPELNRTAFFDVIERVLDAHAMPGQHIRIASLNVDLGTIPFTPDFAQVACERLERELRDAIEKALRELATEPSSARVAPAGEARLQLIEQYLSKGTLPFWAPASDFNLEDVMSEALAATPDGVIRLLRSYRDDAIVIRRLIHQLSESALKRMLRLLDPENAGNIGEELADDEPQVSAWTRVLTRALQNTIPLDGTPVAALLPEGDGIEVSEAGAGGLPESINGPSISRYDQADALRYYLRYGVLPWGAALAETAGRERALNVGELVDVLPALPISLLRTIFPASPTGRFAAALRAVRQMSQEAIDRLIVALSANAHGAATVVDVADADNAADPHAAYARVIVRLLEGNSGWREFDAGSSSVTSAWVDEQPWDVGWIKSILADRARTGERAGSTQPSSAALLQALMEEYPADARHFFHVVRRTGLRPSALLSELASARLFESSVMLLPPGLRGSLMLLLGLVSSLPVRERSDDDAMRSAATRVVLDHVAEEESRARFLAEVARVLFGSSISAATRRYLVAEAERRARASGYPSDLAADLRDALRAVSLPQPRETDGVAEARTIEGTSAQPDAAALFQRSLDDLPLPAARRVAHLLRIVAAWPAAERPGNGNAMRAALAGVFLRHAGASPLGAEFLAAVLQALLGPNIPISAASRLVSEAERLASRGEFAPGDVDAVREALAFAAGAVDQRQRQPPDPHRIVKAPGERAETARRAETEEASPARLLQMLIERSPNGAGLLARVLREAGVTPSTPLAESAPAHADESSSPVAALSDDALRDILVRVIDAAPETVREAVQAAVTDRAARGRWLRLLSESELARITYLLEPQRHRVLIDTAELLFSAWHVVAPRAASDTSSRMAMWSFLLDFLSTGAHADRSVHHLVGEFFTYVGVRQATDSWRSGAAAKSAEQLLQAAITLAERAGSAPLRAALSGNRGGLMDRFTAPGTVGPVDAPADQPPPVEHPARPARRRMAFRMNEDDPQTGGEPIHIANAGLVIAGGFLPQLFERLEVLEETKDGKRRVRRDAVSRTVHLLQYLVDGRTNTPEPLLCVNKVLCGVPLATPIEREIEMTPREQELCDTLLAAIIETWTIIKHTSVAGLRETFLQREGRLDRPSMGWRLRVQRKTVDVLLDQIPWTISTIAHSWMPEPLFVTW